MGFPYNGFTIVSEPSEFDSDVLSLTDVRPSVTVRDVAVPILAD